MNGPYRRTRSSKQAKNNGSHARRDRVAAKDLRDNWDTKYFDFRTPVLGDHFDKFRLRVPLAEDDVVEDMVAMGIWHKDDKGRVIKSRDPVVVAREEVTVEVERETRKTSKRSLQKSMGRSKRHEDAKDPTMTRAEREKCIGEGRERLRDELESFVEKECRRDMARSSASTISLQDDVEDVAPSSASTISLQDEEDGTYNSKAEPSIQANGPEREQPTEPVDDYIIIYDGGSKIILKRKCLVGG